MTLSKIQEMNCMQWYLSIKQSLKIVKLQSYEQQNLQRVQLQPRIPLHDGRHSDLHCTTRPEGTLMTLPHDNELDRCHLIRLLKANKE